MLILPFSYWKSAGPPIGSEALDWSARVTAAGGSVSSPTLTAVSNFVSACKTAGIWTKLKRVNLFCGSNLASCMVPLVNTHGTATETSTGFVSGDYSEATGLTGDGTTKDINTGNNPSVDLNRNSIHLSVYNRSVTLTGAGFVAGSSGLSGTGNWDLIFPNNDGKIYSDMPTDGVDTGRIISGVITGPWGYCVGSRTSGTDHRLYRNGTQIGLTTVSNPATLPINSTRIFATNFNGTIYRTAHTLAGYTYGDGLTPTEAQALTTAMEAFQDALGRGVV